MNHSPVKSTWRRWPVPFIRGPLLKLARWSELATCHFRWLGTAVAMGCLPYLISFATRLRGQHIVSGILLAVAAWSLVRHDRWRAGMGLLAVSFLCHSALAIGLTYHDPARAAAVMPSAEDYWQKQLKWIQTGQDPEYVTSYWILAHLRLIAMGTGYTVLSLGATTLSHGFLEVDLMNYYNGQLLLVSRDRAWALLLGWHVWSLLRGVGFTILTYELIRLSFHFFIGERIPNWKAVGWRFAAGGAFLLADGIAKAILLGPVRDRLFENLLV